MSGNLWSLDVGVDTHEFRFFCEEDYSHEIVHMYSKKDETLVFFLPFETKSYVK